MHNHRPLTIDGRAVKKAEEIIADMLARLPASVMRLSWANTSG